MERYIKALPIIYLRPEPDADNAIQLSGDSAWNLVNQPDNYVIPVNGRPAYLHPTNPHRLLRNNIFGNTWRRTGINGGYYDIDTAQYKSSAGTVSTQAAEFGTTTGSTAYLIDHHTGLGWKWNVQGAKPWSGHTQDITTINTGSGWAGYYDWLLPNRKQYESITSYESPGITWTTTFAPFNSANSCKTSTAYLSVGTTQHFYRTGVNFSNRTDATNDAAYLCRYHFTGQT